MIPVITIDGPAASGKTTVSRELANRLGWLWVSTGAFYRGLAYVSDQMGVDPANEDELAALATNPCWHVELAADRTRVFYNDNDVTDQIFRERVGSIASLISQHPKVRKALLEAQRQCASRGAGLVAEGRDCGTVVFPQAQLKVYLTAEAESRALRRAQETGKDPEELMKKQKQRDLQDSSRREAPLAIPPGALVIDSSELTPQQVVEQILEMRAKLS